MMRLTATTARGRNGKDDRRCEYRNRSPELEESTGSWHQIPGWLKRQFVACSYAYAIRRIVASPNSGPNTCNPTGMFPENPAGTEIPGRPAMFAGTVHTSLRYIDNGSSTREPMGNATVGDVGVSNASNLLNASRKLAEYKSTHLLRLLIVRIVVAR